MRPLACSMNWLALSSWHVFRSQAFGSPSYHTALNALTQIPTLIYLPLSPHCLLTTQLPWPLADWHAPFPIPNTPCQGSVVVNVMESNAQKAGVDLNAKSTWDNLKALPAICDLLGKLQNVAFGATVRKGTFEELDVVGKLYSTIVDALDCCASGGELDRAVEHDTPCSKTVLSIKQLLDSLSGKLEELGIPSLSKVLHGGDKSKVVTMLATLDADRRVPENFSHQLAAARFLASPPSLPSIQDIKTEQQMLSALKNYKIIHPLNAELLGQASTYQSSELACKG